MTFAVRQQRLSPDNHIHELNHENAAVNFMNLLANWYVGRKTQKHEGLFWDEFVKPLKVLLGGDMTAVVNILLNNL